MRIIIITGLSGSGKSTVLRALEDSGFFCVDNLPILLLPQFLELQQRKSPESQKVALVMDIREPEFIDQNSRVFSQVRQAGYLPEILFLEASDESLVRRFSQTRRQHPVAPKGQITKGISIERERLDALREISNRIIDTSILNVHQLREMIISIYQKEGLSDRMNISILSFGYKYGLPQDADIVIDVRFLPNPFFIEELTKKTGNEPEVVDYIFQFKETNEFINIFKDSLDFLIPLYQREGKSYLTIAIGCTGGKHRSVAVTNELGSRMKANNYNINISHRDIELG
ncbi:MAG: RNase adapter RapZ [Deltaproteobacteria bacterium]|nr:RNase adapter RapZ [Deltaproteobacteria bacterium]